MLLKSYVVFLHPIQLKKWITPTVSVYYVPFLNLFIYFKMNSSITGIALFYRCYRLYFKKKTRQNRFSIEQLVVVGSFFFFFLKFVFPIIFFISFHVQHANVNLGETHLWTSNITVGYRSL